MSVPHPLPPTPPQPPTPASAAERAVFDKLVDSSLSDTRAAAEKWRTGLAALVTLTTTALLIKGPDSSADLSAPWRVVISLLLMGGLSSSVLGLWQALKAASGTRSLASYDDIISTYKSVRSYQVAQANGAAQQLAAARHFVAAALALLVLGQLLWWLAPQTKPQITVSTQDKQICGTLLSADGGQVRVKVRGQDAPEAIPLAAVRNLSVQQACK